MLINSDYAVLLQYTAGCCSC